LSAVNICAVLPFAPLVRSARLLSMDERALKRLLVMVAVSIIAIFLFKAMMSNTIVNLNRAAAEKKQAAPASPAAQKTEDDSDNTIEIESSAASSAGEDEVQEPSPAY
jgi:flagellar biosynthesis/type III secretory pathway M-ring protein FliF/YscJ